MHDALFVVSQNGFRDEELFVPREELERAGWRCTIASRHVGECNGMRGGNAAATLALSDVTVDGYDAVVFVGGNGAHAFFDDTDALRIARECDAKGKILGAICVAPGILARAGVLAGRRATSFSSESAALADAGARVQDASVVVDGRIVTADGPRAAHEFVAAILHVAKPGRARATTQSIRGARVTRRG